MHSALLKFRPPSGLEPRVLRKTHPVEIFIKQFMNKISDPSFLNAIKPKNNLSESELAALRKLRSDPRIIISPADKIIMRDSHGHY
jgi:hypothetical protein